MDPHDEPAIVARLAHEARRPAAEERPGRCRAVIFNPDGTKVLGIARNKPGREPYVVYPGGGLEDTDATALDGLWRELDEEVQLGQAQVRITGDVLVQDAEFFYIGVAAEEFDGMVVGGPEAEADEAVSGTYTPGWFDVAQLHQLRMFPEEITSLVVSAAATE